MAIDRQALQAAAHDLGTKVLKGLPRGAGFALVLFDFGDSGSIAYVSNGNRSDVVKTLKELGEKIEKAEPEKP